MDGYEVITDYTETNKYTFPSDGYLEIQATSVQSDNAVKAVLQGANETTGVILYEHHKSETIFVSKGMKYYTLATTGNPSVFFVPFS